MRKLIFIGTGILCIFATMIARPFDEVVRTDLVVLAVAFIAGIISLAGVISMSKSKWLNCLYACLMVLALALFFVSMNMAPS